MMEDKKRILKNLIMLSIPTILEQILSTLLQYVDTAMVGRLGERATAAVSVSTSINWLLHSVAAAVGVGALAMIAKAYGGGDKEKIKMISKQTLFIGGIVGILLTVICLSVSSRVPVWMGAEESVQGPAAVYFFIICAPLLFRTLSIVLGSAIRAVQDTKTPMYINLAANGMNVVLNYLLIYTFGLGVTGAAIATAISYTTAGIGMFIAFRKKEILSWKWSSFKIDREILGEEMRLSLPVLGTSLVSCMGYVFFAGMVSGMGTTIFAAHSIAVSAEELFYIPGYGLRTATSALVGASLGEKNERKFEIISLLSTFLAVGMMLVSGIVLFFVSYPLMTVFTSSVPVAELGARMLKLVAFSEPFFGLMIVMEGIFYGLGYTKYSFLIESSSMWGIRIFFTFLCVKVWHLDLQAVWYCMIADNVTKAILLSLPIRTSAKRKQLFER